MCHRGLTHDAVQEIHVGRFDARALGLDIWNSSRLIAFFRPDWHAFKLQQRSGLVANALVTRQHQIEDFFRNLDGRTQPHIDQAAQCCDLDCGSAAPLVLIRDVAPFAGRPGVDLAELVFLGGDDSADVVDRARNENVRLRQVLRGLIWPIDKLDDTIAEPHVMGFGTAADGGSPIQRNASQPSGFNPFMFWRGHIRIWCLCETRESRRTHSLRNSLGIHVGLFRSEDILVQANVCI